MAGGKGAHAQNRAVGSSPNLESPAGLKKKREPAKANPVGGKGRTVMAGAKGGTTSGSGTSLTRIEGADDKGSTARSQSKNAQTDGHREVTSGRKSIERKKPTKSSEKKQGKRRQPSPDLRRDGQASIRAEDIGIPNAQHIALSSIQEQSTKDRKPGVKTTDYNDLDESIRRKYQGAWQESDEEDKEVVNEKETAAQEEEEKQNSDPPKQIREDGEEEPKKLSAWAAERQAFLGNKRVYDLAHEDSETRDCGVREWGAGCPKSQVSQPEYVLNTHQPDREMPDASLRPSHSTNRAMQTSKKRAEALGKPLAAKPSPFDDLPDTKLMTRGENLNSIGYKMGLSRKYASTKTAFRVYQTKEHSEYRPFEQFEVNQLEPKLRQKYERYLYGDYKGENELGVPEGAGKLTFDIPNILRSDHQASEIRALFRGEFRLGRLVHGFLLLLDNSYYVGDFNPNTNKYNGVGRLTFTDQVHYQGAWVNGQRHGYGEELMCNGNKYVGNFHRDMKHGQGRIIYKLPPGGTGKLCYQGEWFENKFHGRGREFYRMQGGMERVYDGQFENGVRNGFGILTDNFDDIVADHKERQKLMGHECSMDSESEGPQQLNSCQNHYCYKGQWRKGVREGFGVESTSVEKLAQDMAIHQKYIERLAEHEVDDCYYHQYKYELHSQKKYFETKYTGFFLNNKRAGEGCVELRDSELCLVGWYLGRYENGVRHGIGQDVFLIRDELTEEDRYRMVERVYNKGFLVKEHSKEAQVKEVDDILSNIAFFGFMGLIERQKPDVGEAGNQLNLNIDLEIPDREFPESNNVSMYDQPREAVDAKLMEQYDKLEWQPIRSHLFVSDFNSILEYDNSHSILEFNRDLSSLIGIISGNPGIMKSFFPQTRMYYSKEEEEVAGRILDNQVLKMNGSGAKFCKHSYYYEGFVRIHDEGYLKTVYVNSYVPFDPESRRHFYINTLYNESWVLLLVKAMAKYCGSYDTLSLLGFDALSQILFGSRSFPIGKQAFHRIYNAKYPISKSIQQKEAVEDVEKEVSDGGKLSLYDIYRDISQALESGKFLVVARKKVAEKKKKSKSPHRKADMTGSLKAAPVSAKMMEQVSRAFTDGFHYAINDIPTNAGSSSNIEINSKLAAWVAGALNHQSKIIPTVAQLDYLFTDFALIQNPLHTHKTLYQTIFTPTKAQKLYVLILEFQVNFAKTLVQMNVAIQGRDSDTKIRALPVQYFIGKQYKHQHMYVGGRGQQNVASFSDTHCFEVGNYQMLIELELPDDELVGKALKLKVAMQSTETYFMLANKYAEILPVSDLRAQVFYKQMYSSLAMQNEERQYFGLHGEIKAASSSAPAPQQKQRGGEEAPSTRIKEKQRLAALAPSPTFMIQHYNTEHKAYIQYIQNDSDSLNCVATTAIKYRNMLQMGDAPVAVSPKESKTEGWHPNDGLQEPTPAISQGESDDKAAQETQKRELAENENGESKSVESIGMLSAGEEALSSDGGAAASQVKEAMKDISCFTREVYEQITGAVQSYSVDQAIDCGGNTCVLVVRRLRGGTGDKFRHGREAVDWSVDPPVRVKPSCEFVLEVERTSIRLVQAQRIATVGLPAEPRGL